MVFLIFVALGVGVVIGFCIGRDVNGQETAARIRAEEEECRLEAERQAAYEASRQQPKTRRRK